MVDSVTIEAYNDLSRLLKKVDSVTIGALERKMVE